MEEHYVIEKEYFEDFNKQYGLQINKSKKYEIFVKSILIVIFAEFIISIIFFVSFGYQYLETTYIIIIGIEISSIIFSLAGIFFMCVLPTNKFMQMTMWLLFFLQIVLFIILIVREFIFLKKNHILLIIMIISCIIKFLLTLLLAICLRRYYISQITIMRIKNKLNEQKAILENSGKLLGNKPIKSPPNSINLNPNFLSYVSPNIDKKKNFQFQKDNQKPLNLKRNIKEMQNLLINESNFVSSIQKVPNLLDNSQKNKKSKISPQQTKRDSFAIEIKHYN